MLDYIYNECKRIAIKKKISIILALIFSLAIAVSLAIYLKSNTIEKRINGCNETKEYYQKSLNNVQTEEDKKSLQKRIDSCNQDIEDLKEEKDELENYDINKIDEKVNMLKRITITNDNREIIDHKIETLNYYKNNNITKANLSAKGMEGATYFIGTIMPALIIIISTVLFSDIISGDFHSKTIKMIFSRSMSRGKLLAGKFIAANIIILILEVLINTMSIIIFSVICGFGDYKAPTIKNVQYSLNHSKLLLIDQSQMDYLNMSLTSNIKLVFMIMGILFLFSITIVSITIFISNISKNILTTAFTNIGAYLFASFFYIKYFMSGNFIQKYEYGKVFKYIPITYLDIYDSIQGKTAYDLNTNLVSIKFIVMLLLMWCIIMYSLSYILFKNKRI